MLDWSRSSLVHPALDSVRAYVDRVAELDRWPSVAELDAILRDRLEIEPPVGLEVQGPKKRRRGALDREALYVVRIHDARRIPTRERSWHDLLNAAVWAAFPASKRALTARQRAITEERVPPGAREIPSARSREEDALAMLDEGGIVVLARDATTLAHAHRAGDVATMRAAVEAGKAAVHVFGHALMEHAIGGTDDVRGYAVVLACDRGDHHLDVDAADRALALWIARGDELSAPAPWRALALAALRRRSQP